MRCPHCKHPKTEVSSTKPQENRTKTLRYCRCPKCRLTFKTLEQVVERGFVLHVG